MDTTAFLFVIGREPDDGSLVARARAGDRAALEALVSRHLRDVYDVAVRILGDHDLAQDAVQDAMTNALGALGRFRGEASFRTWLLRIAANAARTLARRRGRRREVALEAAEAIPSGAADPGVLTVVRDEADRVARAIGRLPEKQRLAVTLRIYQGLSYREVAQVAGGSEGAARVNYHLGIKRLRELLQ